MITLSGEYYDGSSSKAYPCRLVIRDKTVAFDDIDKQSIALASLRISPQIGRTPCNIDFGDGSKFVTSAHAALNDLRRLQGKGRFLGLVHHWEANRRFWLPSTVVLFCFLIAFLLFGLPVFSQTVAKKLPPEVALYLGQQALQTINDEYFTGTKVPLAEQRRLTTLFSNYLPEESSFNYNLYFRQSKLIGANAFALPDGSVVVTDALLTLADDDQELLAILLHEIGHVEHRHGLRMMVQAITVFGYFTLMTGDLDTVSETLALFIPLALNSHYSREYEIEADNYALASLNKHNISPHKFADILTKLSAQPSPLELEKNRNKEPSEEEQKDGVSEQIAEHKNTKVAVEVLGLFASHPPTQERIEKFKQAAK